MAVAIVFTLSLLYHYRIKNARKKTTDSETLKNFFNIFRFFLARYLILPIKTVPHSSMERGTPLINRFSDFFDYDIYSSERKLIASRISYFENAVG